MSSNPGPSPRRPWSLAARLTVWYAAVTFALVFAATGYLYWALARNLDREDDQFLLDKVTAVRRVMEQSPGDRAVLEQYVRAASTDRVFLRVSPGSGRPAVESPGMPAILPPGMFPDVSSPPPFEKADEVERPNGRGFRLLAWAEPQGDSVVQVAMDNSTDEELLAGYRRQLLYVLGLSLLAAVGGGYWIARRGLRPIAAVTATARRIGPAHLSERIAAAGLPAEVRDLADTFNPMLARLEDAFGRLGRFSADIAHELRTPVNALRVQAEVALQRPRPPEEYREVLGSCLEECGRLKTLIDSLLFLARAEDPKTELVTTAVDVAAELRAIRELFDPAAAEAGVRLDVDAANGPTIRADKTLVHQAVGNLVSNALAHTPAGGAVTLSAAATAAGVAITVQDTGPGIPAEHLPYVFDRFYRADPARSAGGRVGLGLALVKAVAELHGGSVAAESPPGSGAAVTLTLPAASGVRAAGS
jgi:two-component system, OmpR family, heavy metal sensor histidine kinase CusS